MEAYWKEALAGAGIGAVVALAVWGVDVTPILVMAGLVILMQTMLTGRLTGGRKLEAVTVDAKNSIASPVTFDDIGGQETAKRELLEALEFINNRARCAQLGIRPLKGILLAGPPGTGKTLLAKAAAGFTNSAFVAASGSSFIEMYAGVGAQRIRQLFAKGRQAAAQQGKDSAVIFIDEIEVIVGKRGRHSSHL